MERFNSKRADPGVPEALPRTLVFLRDDRGAEALDRLWIFPPLVKGRRERGLVVATTFADGDSRNVVTASYAAERTGRGLTFEPHLEEEGVSPADRLPRLIGGVVRRSEVDLGEPREVSLGGDPLAFDALLADFDEALLLEDVLPS